MSDEVDEAEAWCEPCRGVHEVPPCEPDEDDPWRRRGLVVPAWHDRERAGLLLSGGSWDPEEAVTWWPDDTYL